jgi:TM2 domain-containing membrane protein YozV
MFCANCGKEVSDKAIVCTQCGCGIAQNLSAEADKRNKNIAGILALLLGGLGVHKFYHGHPVIGTCYILFMLGCWGGMAALESSYYNNDGPTMILGCLLFVFYLSCMIEGIVYLTMKKSNYDKRYNETTPEQRIKSDWKMIINNPVGRFVGGGVGVGVGGVVGGGVGGVVGGGGGAVVGVVVGVVVVSVGVVVIDSIMEK